MSVLALNATLVREVLLPGLPLTPGRALMARVVAAEAGRGTLAIAGYTVEATLPEDIRAGQELRLLIRDVDAHRVLLTVAAPAGSAPTGTAGALTPTPAPAPPAAPVELPGGASVQAVGDQAPDREGGDGRDRGHRPEVALSFRGAGVGAIDLRLTLDASTLRVSVSLDPGESLNRGTAAVPALRAALASVAERPTRVTVVPRRRPLDLYA